MVKKAVVPQNEDRFSTETKRLAIKDVEGGMSRLAVAMKYKVAVGDLLLWLNNRERIKDDKCAKRDRQQAEKRLALKRTRVEPKQAPPKWDYSKVPKPRIRPYEDILASAEKKHDDKKKIELEMYEKEARAKLRSRAAVMADIRRERIQPSLTCEKKSFVDIEDSSSENGNWVPKTKISYHNLMFDEEYYTYKTIFTNDEDIIEIWSNDQITSRPNIFYNVHQFVQNPSKEKVEEIISDKDESFSKWSDSKKQKAYDRLINLELYLSDSEELSINDNPSDMGTIDSVDNSSDNMVEMVVSVPTEKYEHLSSSSSDLDDYHSQTSTCDISDKLSESKNLEIDVSGSINEDESLNTINDIIKDKNMWDALSTEIIHELHTTESFPKQSEEEQNVEPKETSVKTSVEIEPEITQKRVTRQTKSSATKKLIDIGNIEVPKKKRGRTKKVNETTKDNEDNIVKKSKVDVDDTTKLPPKRGRAKKIVEVIENVPPEQDKIDKLKTKRRNQKDDNTVEVPKVPVKATRRKKVVEDKDKPEKIVRSKQPKCKGRECQEQNVKNVKRDKNKSKDSLRVSKLYKDVFEDETVSNQVIQTVPSTCNAQEQVSLSANRESYDFDGGW